MPADEKYLFKKCQRAASSHIRERVETTVESETAGRRKTLHKKGNGMFSSQAR